MAASPSSLSMPKQYTEDSDDVLRTTKGSCLCKAIEFTIAGRPFGKLICHCMSCKKSSGSSFMALNIYETSQLLLDPTSVTNPKIKTYSDTTTHSGNTISRVFCADCGSRLWISSPKRPGHILVHVAVLDVDFNLAGEGRSWKPDREIWCRWKEEWLDKAGPGEEERFEMGS